MNKIKTGDRIKINEFKTKSEWMKWKMLCNAKGVHTKKESTWYETYQKHSSKDTYYRLMGPYIILQQCTKNKNNE